MTTTPATTHELIYTSHQHVGPAQHRNEGECSCGGATYVSTAKTDLAARGNVREQHHRHVRRVEKASA